MQDRPNAAPPVMATGKANKWRNSRDLYKWYRHETKLGARSFGSDRLWLRNTRFSWWEKYPFSGKFRGLIFGERSSEMEGAMEDEERDLVRGWFWFWFWIWVLMDLVVRRLKKKKEGEWKICVFIYTKKSNNFFYLLSSSDWYFLC